MLNEPHQKPIDAITHCTVLRSHKAVAAYLKSKQLLPFAHQYSGIYKKRDDDFRWFSVNSRSIFVKMCKHSYLLANLENDLKNIAQYKSLSL